MTEQRATRRDVETRTSNARLSRAQPMTWITVASNDGLRSEASGQDESEVSWFNSSRRPPSTGSPAAHKQRPSSRCPSRKGDFPDRSIRAGGMVAGSFYKKA